MDNRRLSLLTASSSSARWGAVAGPKTTTSVPVATSTAATRTTLPTGLISMMTSPLSARRSFIAHPRLDVARSWGRGRLSAIGSLPLFDHESFDEKRGKRDEVSRLTACRFASEKALRFGGQSLPVRTATVRQIGCSRPAKLMARITEVFSVPKLARRIPPTRKPNDRSEFGNSIRKKYFRTSRRNRLPDRTAYPYS
jgi:hypothetical protein